MQVSSVESALSQLTESSKQRARDFVGSGERLWCLVYDNINFTFRKASQRLHNATEQINATTSAVIALPACFATTAFEGACRVSNQTQRQQSSGRRKMTLHELVPTLEQQSQLRSAFRHAVCSLLLDNLPGLKGDENRIRQIKSKVAAAKLVVRPLEGAGEKTNFYPLPALNEEESSVRGTIRVVQKLVRDILGLGVEIAASKLRFFVGDWLTIRNLRLMKYIRITEPEAWGRMDWVQEVAMPFHFQLNAMYMLFRTHLGESDNNPSCLDRHWTRLRRYKLDKKKPEFNQARELMEQSLVARLLDITRFVQCFSKSNLLTGCSIRIILKLETTEELYEWQPRWQEFNGVVHTIVDEYSMVFEADTTLATTDNVLKHSKLFIRDALIFWVFSDAIRHEDVGLMWLVYTFWLFMFRGVGCHNYGNELLEMTAQFRYEMTEQL